MNKLKTPLRLAVPAAFATFCALAMPLAQAQDSGSRNPGSNDLRFEGVWAKPGSVTLIKQFPKHLVLQGKDEASVWSARCVLGGGKAVCRGHGFTITGYDFAYESVVTLEGGQMRDVWRAVFPDAQDLTGNDLLSAVPLPAFKPARKAP
jgi:hypothetical protein